MKFDPTLHYSPHPQDNPHFTMQHGFITKPLQSTLDGIAAACDQQQTLQEPVKLRGNQLNQYKPKRPLKPRKYLNQGFQIAKNSKKCTHRIKVGPCFFPVNKN